MKKLIKISTLIVLTMICMASSCDDKSNEHKYFTIVNKSSMNIRCQMILQGIITPADTIYQCNNIPFLISADSLYLNKSPGHNRGGWETTFGEVPYLQLLIMNDSIYRYYSRTYNFNCDTIRKYVPILHRYQLKLEDLQRMNWIVVYPPEE